MVATFDPNTAIGLSEQNAIARLKDDGYNKKTLSLAVLQGGGILAIILAIFAIALYRKQGEFEARALTFTTLILANLGLILSEGSTSRLGFKILKSPNPTLWLVLGGGLLFLGLVLYVPFLRHLFSFSFLHPIDLATCLGGGLISLLWFELLKQTTKIRPYSETGKH